jgi:exportin-1
MISRMPKPMEVLLSVDENGYPIQEKLEDTEKVDLYDIMKNLLINLAKLDWSNMETILRAKLEAQIDQSEWSFENLNCLCWAIGSISGALPETLEKQFIIHTLRVQAISAFWLIASSNCSP